MLDVGCGYGYRPYLLHFAAKGRSFTGIDYNEDKIETADNCFSKDGEINFNFADAFEFKFETYDAIILAVSHEEFLKIDYKAYQNKGAVIFDTKSFIDRNFVDGRL